jgi:Uncharacterised nucleotidyltransferase
MDGWKEELVIGHPAEARFIVACMLEADALTPNALSRAAQAVRDWRAVVKLAGRHRVAAHVLRAADSNSIQLPQPAREQLRNEVLACQAVAMLLEEQLQHLAQDFAQVRIPFIVLKGPALVRTVYSEPELRPYADLDLTVQSASESEAGRLLANSGYLELEPETHATQACEHPGLFHRQFGGMHGYALIELHTEPLQLGLRPTCEAGRWARAIPLPRVPGALMLGTEDQLVQLSLHAQKHGYNRLIWLKDIDLWLRTFGNTLNWALVEEIARSEGVIASVWYTLQLANKVLGTPLPSAAACVKPGPAMRFIYPVVWPTARVARLEGFVRRRAVQFRAAESWRGMLPSIVLMGRRRTRARMLLANMFGASTQPANHS